MLRQIRVSFDQDRRTLSYETIVQIFDKRQIARGIKQLKNEFKNKRRTCLMEKKHDAYKKVVLHYKKLIESRLESNLQLIARRVLTHFTSN
jgi:hypothetical protein